MDIPSSDHHFGDEGDRHKRVDRLGLNHGLRGVSDNAHRGEDEDRHYPHLSVGGRIE